jgi:cytochrome d ubiquinol oxidase subunit II
VTLATLWFCFAGFSLAAYVVLDGFDLGAGLVAPLVAKTPDERRLVAASIGPVWDGNEVWLLASGGTLVFAFPELYAVSVSGFYLPVMLLMWLFTLRALGIEMRHQLSHPLWEEAWGVAFSTSSLLIALFLGVALGNVVRGVSIDEGGRFFAPLWTDLRVGDDAGVLDWYTVLVGLLGVSVLGLHGSLWLGHRTRGPVRERAEALARRGVPIVIVLLAVVTVATLAVQPLVLASLRGRPWGAAFPAMSLAALAFAARSLFAKKLERAFWGSSAFVAALFASAAFGVYPYVLPARVASRGLTVDAAKTSSYALTTGLGWWLPGMAIAVGYFVFTYRKLPREIGVEDLHDPP